MIQFSESKIQPSFSDDQLPDRLRVSEQSEWEDEFEDEEYDIPVDRGILFEILLFPFDLLMAIVSTIFDVLGLIPYTIRCFHALWRDVVHASRFYGHHSRVALNRFVIGPIHFAVTDPVGAGLYLVDRTLFVVWCLRVAAHNLHDEMLEQLGDVGRLMELLWVQSKEVFNAAEINPSPIHAVPLRTQRVLLETQAAIRTRQQASRGVPRFVLMPKREVAEAEGGVTEDEAVAVPTLIPPVEFKPSLRTRLADPDSVPDPDELEDEARESSHRTKGYLSLFTNFYQKCPHCASEEIYALKSDGGFAKSDNDFSLIVQKMYCERCITPFLRPGKIFLAPKPALRPSDSDMYDR